jgi:ABC-type nitrate/sulfonate/bicarbonate transport system substrate-binding protein
MAKQIWTSLTLVARLASCFAGEGRAQTLEKVLITHSSDSISITPLLYGIEKNFYRKEGIDLSFRVLRGELAVSAIVSGKDVDYIYGAGTASFVAVRDLPMKVFSHDFKSVFFYLMGNSRVQSGPDLKGKKVAVASEDKKGATEFIAKKFGLDANSAQETYKVMLQTMTQDGIVSEADLKDLLEQARQETGTRREIVLKDIVDYSLLRQVSTEMGR